MGRHRASHELPPGVVGCLDVLIDLLREKAEEKKMASVATNHGMCIHALNAATEEIAALRAALVAQQEADDANENRAGYETWQALQDKAEEMRRAVLNREPK